MSVRPSSELLPVPVPRCPACDVALVPEGGRRDCPRCGRVFISTLVKAGGTAVYREAPVFDLEPAHDPAPRGRGLRVLSDDQVLDVRIGGPGFLSTAAINATVLGVLAAFFALIPIELHYHLTFGIIFAILFVLGAFLVGATAPLRRATEGVSVLRGALTWRRFDDQGILRAEKEVSLAEIVGVRDGDQHVVAELGDGKELAIGRDVRVPRRVRRWLAQRLAERLPSKAT